MKKAAAAGGGERTFVQFILEPLYKIYAQVCAACLGAGGLRAWHGAARFAGAAGCRRSAARAALASHPACLPATRGAQVIGEDERCVRGVMDEFGTALKPASYGMNVKPLLKEACWCGARLVLGWLARWVGGAVAHGRGLRTGCRRRRSLIALLAPIADPTPCRAPPPARPRPCSKIFGSAGGVVDMLVRHTPSSRAATAAKVERCYTGA